jgi:hypothetical protein
VLILPFKFSLFRRDRARKSGRPSLFEPSLKVQRNLAHNPPSGFEVLPQCYDSTSMKLERSILHGAGESASESPAGRWRQRTREMPSLGVGCGESWPIERRASG